MKKTGTEQIKGERVIDPGQEEIFKTDRIRIGKLALDECVQSVEELLKEIDGVQSVRVLPEEGMAEVTYDSRRMNLPLLHQILLRSGYKTE